MGAYRVDSSFEEISFFGLFRPFEQSGQEGEEFGLVQVAGVRIRLVNGQCAAIEYSRLAGGVLEIEESTQIEAGHGQIRVVSVQISLLESKGSLVGGGRLPVLTEDEVVVALGVDLEGHRSLAQGVGPGEFPAVAVEGGQLAQSGGESPVAGSWLADIQEVKVEAFGPCRLAFAAVEIGQFFECRGGADIFWAALRFADIQEVEIEAFGPCRLTADQAEIGQSVQSALQSILSFGELAGDRQGLLQLFVGFVVAPLLHGGEPGLEMFFPGGHVRIFGWRGTAAGEEGPE